MRATHVCIKKERWDELAGIIGSSRKWKENTDIRLALIEEKWSQLKWILVSIFVPSVLTLLIVLSK